MSHKEMMAQGWDERAKIMVIVSFTYKNQRRISIPLVRASHQRLAGRVRLSKGVVGMRVLKTETGSVQKGAVASSKFSVWCVCGVRGVGGG